MLRNSASLLRPLDMPSKLAIEQEVFGFEASSKRFVSRGGFLEYLDAELERFVSARRYFQVPIDSGSPGLVEDLLLIIKTLKQERTSTRYQVHSKLRNHFQAGSKSGLDISIDLAMNLMTMLNVRNACFQLQTPQTPVIQWDDSSTLEAVATRQFPLTSWSISSRDGRLHPSFTVAAMTRICGLKVAWTLCLADHLRLDQRSKVLKVFPYKQCLLDHLEGVKTYSQPGLLPDSILIETIQSLDLLFPHWDLRTNKLLKEHDQFFHQLGPFPSARKLNLCEFGHWRDRLAELYEEVYCCPPASWAQLWADRRNPQQWYTFWIALVILLLTVVSTFSSMVQAWASVEALHRA